MIIRQRDMNKEVVRKMKTFYVRKLGTPIALFVIIGALIFAVYSMIIKDDVVTSSLSFEEVAKKSSSDTKYSKKIHLISKGENLADIFQTFGIDRDKAYLVIKTLGQIYNPKRCQIGDKLVFTFNGNGELERLRYFASPVDIYQVILKNDKAKVSQINIPLDVRTERISVKLENSLYQDLVSKGEKAGLIEKIIDVLAWDIDFFVDTRNGDHISILVEKNYVDNLFYEYGKIIALDYDGFIVKQTAFYFDDSKGKSGYFDEHGKSLARNFLKTPVKFTRISSKFGMRKHPVTHKLKKHLGTDYAAPVGTPVWAMSDGVVVKKAYGKYNGKYIAVKHGKGYETQYLHLSRFHPSIKVGKKIKQKELIGYVGTTGRSTGPHLHLSVKYHGKFINPLKLKKVKETTLTGAELAYHKMKIVPYIALLKNADTKQDTGIAKRSEIE